MNNSADTAVAGFFAVFGLVFAILGLAVMAFYVWVFWRILTKAGMNGALALLNLVPLGSLVVLCILAFSDWPMEQQMRAMLGGTTPPPPTPPSAPPPGTTITRA